MHDTLLPSVAKIKNKTVKSFFMIIAFHFYYFDFADFVDFVVDCFDFFFVDSVLAGLKEIRFLTLE